MQDWESHPAVLSLSHVRDNWSITPASYRWSMLLEHPYIIGRTNTLKHAKILSKFASTQLYFEVFLVDDHVLRPLLSFNPLNL